MPRAVNPPSDARTQPAGLEPGSFRDPESRVFYDGDEVFRALSPDGLSDFEALRESSLLDDERVVRTELVEDAGAARRGLLVHEPAGVLRHERIPFVSYPYEWTFSMLKDAALLQLDLLLAALDHDLVLKDSTPYNVQFKGARPVFVDVGSFERLREGEPWVGYRQFCMLYLYPLLLQAVKDVPFHPWLRGSIDGITPRQMRDLMSFRDRFRRGLFTNVFLHARLEARYADRPARSSEEVKRRLQEGAVRRQRAQDAQAGRAARVGPAAGRLDRLRRAQQLHRRGRAPQGRVRPPGRHVAALGPRLGHRRQQRPLLAHRRRGRRRRWSRSTPTRARSSCSTATCAARATSRSCTLTMNLADPSPGLGWRGLERKVDARPRQAGPGAGARARPPRRDQRQRAGQGVHRLARLARRRRSSSSSPRARTRWSRSCSRPSATGCTPTTSCGYFERILGEAFDVERSERLESGTRVLYFARPKRG